MCSVTKLRKEAVVEKLVGGDNLCSSLLKSSLHEYVFFQNLSGF